MKKIYMILAAIALLSLSLNAQTMTADHSNCQVNSMQAKGLSIHSSSNNSTTSSKYSFINLLRSTKGMSTIMPQLYDGTPVKGLLRAPLRINSDEVTVGPFTGDNFDNGVGFANAYSSPQEIFIETDLLQSEYADYIGEDIIGFRLALAGDATNTVQIGEFMAWPGNSDGSFDQDHLYTWSIGELTSGTPEPYTQYVRINSTSDLESGAEYLIVCENNNVVFNGGLNTLDAAGNTISVTPSDGIIESTSTTDAATFTITANGNNYTVRSKSGYYIGRTQNSNGLQSSTTNAYTNTITFSGNNASIRCSASTARYLRYNSNASDRRFRYYQTTTGQNIQLYKKVTVTPTAPAYVALQDGQWHEFYLDNPVPFVVGSDNVSLSLGYTYIQYPTGTTGENLFPIAVNSQSTSHNHYAYMTVESQGGGAGDITITCQNCFQTSFYYIIVVDNATGDYLTYWAYNGATYTNGDGQTCWELPNGWSLDGAAYFYQETVSGYNLGYLSTNGPGSIVISSSAFGNNPNVSVLIAAAGWGDGYTVSVNGDAKTIEAGTIADYEWNPVNFSGGGGTTTNTGWYQQDFSQFGDLAVQLIFKSKIQKTPTPVITYVVNGDNVVITATGEGTVTLTVGNETQSGTGSVSITVPRTDTTYNVTATATAKDGDKEESDPATEIITIPFLQTATPVITYTNDGENVIITATGDGTVTLTVDGQTVSGQGSANITVPCGATSTTVTATATAQEEGKAVSETATAQVPIPGGQGWIEMDGTYDNPNTLLSFLKGGEDIMLIDQFLASTLKNDHPDGYTYTLREIVNREEKISSPVNIPVYKTNSKMNGFYTKGQVDTADLKMGLKAQVINSEMCNDVDPDHNTLYHSLYRGDKNAAYPVIDVQHRVSQLQKYEDMVDGNVHYFFTETHTSGITPRYDNIGRQIVERLDTNYVQGVFEDSLAYVPVIWTFGLYTGREDGKNNSYGSDIKREYLGAVSATIEGSMSNERPYGTWTADGVEYCVYTPVITIEGTPPAIKVDNDGDVSTYEPYMYRAWCLYEGAHDFKRVNGSLADNGELAAPILLGTVPTTEAHAIIGGEWSTNSGHLPWAFGIPVSECDHPENVTFAIRFYYKKTVTEAGQSEPNSLRDGEEGQEYYIVECEGDAHGISTAINELFNGRVPVETIYYNSVGMQSNKPFDGINIVVTRYSDGTTSTSKIVR